MQDKNTIFYLDTAKEMLKQRGKEYDSNGDERSMKATVEAFNAVTEGDMSEEEGWLFMLLLKQVRQFTKPKFHEDSAIDSIAYNALLAECLAGKDRK